MHGMVNIAVRAARRAGEIMVRQMNQLEALKVVEKSRNEFVSQVDQAAEAAIIEVIKDHYPDHAILAEESGAAGEHEYQWIIDPLDGTTNYLHGFPQFSVSIAVARKGELEHGVVYDPLRQEIFTASRGQGAQLDGRRIRVSKRTTLQQSLVATGFPYRANLEHIERYLNMLRAVMLESAGVRRPGSAALDLCYVAAGRVDAFFELGLEQVGHRGRRADHPRSRRPHQRLPRRRRLPRERQRHRRQPEDLRRSVEAAGAVFSRSRVTVRSSPADSGWRACGRRSTTTSGSCASRRRDSRARASR